MAEPFRLLAQPWWVNLLLAVPLVAAWRWRRHPLAITRSQLLYSGLFGAAFGFVEAAVVVYLRAAVGLLPGYHGTLADVRAAANSAQYSPQYSPMIFEFPRSLLAVELFREAATLIMLVAVAALAARALRERWAIFLWCFAFWDAFYYAGLWATVRWPESLKTTDVLFLIPVIWVAQVWFPLLVCAVTVIAILFGCRRVMVSRSAAAAD